MKVKEGSISYWLLFALEKTADGLLSIDALTYSSQIKALKGIPEPRRKKNLVLAIKRLKNKGVIEYTKSQNDSLILRLTNLGYDYISQNKETENYGKYTVVIWDIPENRRTIRNLLRRRLKSWGFISWQKSVWITRRNVANQLRSLIAELEIDKWVAVIETEDQTLSKVFAAF